MSELPPKFCDLHGYYPAIDSYCPSCGPRQSAFSIGDDQRIEDILHGLAAVHERLDRIESRLPAPGHGPWTADDAERWEARMAGEQRQRDELQAALKASEEVKR